MAEIRHFLPFHVAAMCVFHPDFAYLTDWCMNNLLISLINARFMCASVASAKLDNSSLHGRFHRPVRVHNYLPFSGVIPRLGPHLRFVPHGPRAVARGGSGDIGWMSMNGTGGNGCGGFHWGRLWLGTSVGGNTKGSGVGASVVSSSLHHASGPR